MANGSSTLARIQGRGLVETTTKSVEQTGAQLATTPGGALAQGRPPDSAKMAGTPPAKVNALRVAMQDVGSRRLGAIREMAKQDLTADTRVTDNRTRAATVAGRLDEAMAGYINTQLQAEFAKALISSKAQATLKKTIYENNTEKRTALEAAIGKILAGTATDADISTVNAALPKNEQLKFDKDTSASTNATIIANNLYDNMTPEQMQAAFATAVAEANKNVTLSKFLAKDEDTGKSPADTFAQNEGLADSKELEALLRSILPTGKDAQGNVIPADLSKMRLADVTAAIEKWKEDEFKDVTTYQQTLSDPTASKAQRDLALENLRRLGKVGVLALDQKVGDLDAQMQDGDTVKIDDQSFEISEFFEKPEALAQLKGWLDKPDTAPASLKGWIETNRDAIQNKVNELSPDLQALSDKVEANQSKLAIDPAYAPDTDVLKEFFGNIFEPSLEDRYNLASTDTKTKIDMLKDSTTGPVIAALMERLSLRSRDLVGTGLTGKDVFNKLTKDDLNNIVRYGVPKFMDNLVQRSKVSQFTAPTATFTGDTLVAEVRNLFTELGMQDAGILIGRVANRTDLKQFLELIPEKSVLRNYITAEGGFNFNKIKDLLKTYGSSSFSQLADGSTKTNLEDSIRALTNAIRSVPAPTPAVVDYNAYFNLGKDVNNFNWDTMDIETKRERNIFYNEVGPHPEYRIQEEQINIDNYRKRIQEEINTLRAQGWVVSSLGDGTQGGDNIWLENPGRQSRGRNLSVDSDPTNQFGLQTFSNLKMRLQQAKDRQERYRQEYPAREQRYTQNLSKYIAKKTAEEKTKYDSKKALYDEFAKIWG